MLDDRGHHRYAGRHPRRRHAVRGLPRAGRDGRGGRLPGRRPWCPLPTTSRSRRRPCSAARSSPASAPPATPPTSQPGDAVLVIGLGGVGPLGGARALAWPGPSRIIAVDVSRRPRSRWPAPPVRPTSCVAAPDLAKQVRALTEGRGADRALECVGSAATIRHAWTAVRRGGTCVVVGVGPEGPAGDASTRSSCSTSRAPWSAASTATATPPRHPGLVDHVAAGRLDLGRWSPTGSAWPTYPPPSSGCDAARAAARSSSSAEIRGWLRLTGLLGGGRYDGAVRPLLGRYAQLVVRVGVGVRPGRSSS